MTSSRLCTVDQSPPLRMHRDRTGEGDMGSPHRSAAKRLPPRKRPKWETAQAEGYQGQHVDRGLGSSTAAAHLSSRLSSHLPDPSGARQTVHKSLGPAAEQPLEQGLAAGLSALVAPHSHSHCSMLLYAQQGRVATNSAAAAREASAAKGKSPEASVDLDLTLSLAPVGSSPAEAPADSPEIQRLGLQAVRPRAEQWCAQSSPRGQVTQTTGRLPRGNEAQGASASPAMHQSGPAAPHQHALAPSSSVHPSGHGGAFLLQDMSLALQPRDSMLQQQAHAHTQAPHELLEARRASSAGAYGLLQSSLAQNPGASIQPINLLWQGQGLSTASEGQGSRSKHQDLAAMQEQPRDREGRGTAGQADVQMQVGEDRKGQAAAPGHYRGRHKDEHTHTGGEDSNRSSKRNMSRSIVDDQILQEPLAGTQEPAVLSVPLLRIQDRPGSHAAAGGSQGHSQGKSEVRRAQSESEGPGTLEVQADLVEDSSGPGHPAAKRGNAAVPSQRRRRGSASSVIPAPSPPASTGTLQLFLHPGAGAPAAPEGGRGKNPSESGTQEETKNKSAQLKNPPKRSNRSNALLPKNHVMAICHRQGSDGHVWVKYSHKTLQGTQSERVYYSCAEKEALGCKARKIVDRPKERQWRGDSICDVVTIDGEHNHPPLHLSSAGGSSSNPDGSGNNAASQS